MASIDNGRLPARASGESDGEVIVPEVLPPASPVPRFNGDVGSVPPPPLPAPPAGFILNPLSGLLILVLDYAFFGGEAVTLGLGLPLTCLLAFAVSGTGVFLVQRLIVEERPGKALAKAFIAGVVTGVPTPVFGTVFGSLILGVSGLNLLSRLFSRRG